MEHKKNPKYRIEKYSLLFFQFGLILALFTCYLILESKQSPKLDFSTSYSTTILLDEADIPITERQKEKIILKKIPPPPIKQIFIVADDAEIEHELEIETTDIDEDYEVEFQDYTQKEIEREEEEEEVFNFQIVESQAIYPGCENYKNDKNQLYMCFQKSILKHVKKNFKYPEIAKEMGVQGRVIIKFVISKKGKIEKVQVLRGIDKNLDAEALRIVKLLPDMSPASQRGRNVPVSFMLPITFKLQ